jgi:hypothetical protein
MSITKDSELGAILNVFLYNSEQLLIEAKTRRGFFTAKVTLLLILFRF